MRAAVRAASHQPQEGKDALEEAGPGAAADEPASLIIDLRIGDARGEDAVVARNIGRADAAAYPDIGALAADVERLRARNGEVAVRIDAVDAHADLRDHAARAAGLAVAAEAAGQAQRGPFVDPAAGMAGADIAAEPGVAAGAGLRRVRCRRIFEHDHG